MDEKNTKDMVIRCVENKGWPVHTSKSQAGDTLLFEFSKFTPAGQDFSFSAVMKGGSLYSFIREVIQRNTYQRQSKGCKPLYINTI